MRCKGWNVRSYWDDLIGFNHHNLKVRKENAHHKLPHIKCHELHENAKNSISNGELAVFENMKKARFFSELKILLEGALLHVALMSKDAISKKEAHDCKK